MLRHLAGGAASELARVVRGGSWNNNAVNARVAYRNNNVPGNRNNNLGFRLVRVSHIGRPSMIGMPRDHGSAAGSKALRMAEARPVRTDTSLCVHRRAHIAPGAPPGRREPSRGGRIDRDALLSTVRGWVEHMRHGTR